MAWTGSQMMTSFVDDTFDRDAPFDLDLDAFKVPLYNNNITPDNTADAASSSYDTGQWAIANEVSSGTDWDAGGEPLPSPTWTAVGNLITFTAGNVVSGGSNATLVDVFGCGVYDDDVADRLMCFNYFGGVQSVTGGAMTVQWAGTGIQRFTVN